MHAYLLERCKERRATPGDDLISHLVEAEIDGVRLDDEELVNFGSLLLMAGHFTTTALLGNALLCLADHPKAVAEIAADPELLPGAIEEAFRYRTSAAQLARITNEATTIGGVEVPAETVVGISLMSANHDERQFTDPDRFDIRRYPNPHLALGHGIHFCLGASLARLELRVVLSVLIERLGGVRIQPGAALEFYAAPGLHALKSLPLLLG
jgi:cytochrome P450